jgi:integrase
MMTLRYRGGSVSEQSKPHPTEQGLRNKRGKWEYRGKFKGQPFSQVTNLEAVPENILKAQALRTAHLEQLRRGQPVIKQVNMLPSQAVSEFMRFYRGEHPQGGDCKWAASLMASFQFYCEQVKLPLSRVGPADLERFKAWRRDNSIHPNTLRKQLLLLGQFFKFGRKNGWLPGDPFAVGLDAEVSIPTEQDSDVMHVLSPDEEVRYLELAKRESLDLHDVTLIMLEQGPRPDELLSLPHANVDLQNHHFTIWDNSAEGKSKNAHRKLKMTPTVYEIFKRRCAKPGTWVFPSPKLDGPRTTLQKAHERVVKGKRNKAGKYEGGCGFHCRIYDMRHTYATRFACAGGNLPVLSRILGHADLSMLMRYVHPSQADMDRASAWYAAVRRPAAELESSFIEDETGAPEGWPGGPPFGPPPGPKSVKKDLKRPNLHSGKGDS